MESIGQVDKDAQARAMLSPACAFHQDKAGGVYLRMRYFVSKDIG
jgi:hypothetical protein